MFAPRHRVSDGSIPAMAGITCKLWSTSAGAARFRSSNIRELASSPNSAQDLSVANRFPFLTARWLNLALLTYRLDRKMLEPFVPPLCRLDLIDGDAFASLVAFDFADTR